MPDVVGRIVFIDPTTNVSKKENQVFNVANFAIEGEDEVNGNIYPWHIAFQANQEKARLLDDLKPGDYVKIRYNIRGTITKSDKKQPTEKNPQCQQCFNNALLVQIFREQDPYQNAPVTQAAVQQSYQQGNGAANASRPTPTSSAAPQGTDDLPF